MRWLTTVIGGLTLAEVSFSCKAASVFVTLEDMKPEQVLFIKNSYNYLMIMLVYPLSLTQI